MRKKIVYYSDPLLDDFSGTKIKEKPLKNNFRYINRNPIWNVVAWILYYVIALPIALAFCMIKLRIRYKNRKFLKKNRKKGYFLYCNHTQNTADAFNPALITFPKRNYILVNKAAVSIYGLEQIVLMVGGIPVANTLSNMKSMTECIKKRIEEKKAVTIYPEATIWPYNTKIRDFKSASFRYPVDLDAPVYASTMVYRQRKGMSRLWTRRPFATVYIDGPFYPDKTISKKEAMEKLRNEVYKVMCERAHTNENFEYIKYIKK